MASRLRSWIAPYATAGFFFPAANFFNFMQGGSDAALFIAAGNLIYAILLIGGLSRGKPFYQRVDESAPPLRVTSYCALVIAVILLLHAMHGYDQALFPGLAALFFGIGNYLQSSSSRFTAALAHPAIWYGLGYGMTGIAIGGGLSLLQNPSSDIVASGLTLVGIIESAGSLVLLASGKVGRAAPFVGVAMGTILFAITGLLVGNLAGMATGIFACAGELSLAILMQRQNNAAGMNRPASGTETILLWPIRAAMRAGLIRSV